MFSTIALFVTLLSVAYAALPANYQTLSATAKRDILWGKISATPYTTLPTNNPGALASAALFRPSFLVARFTAVTDEFGESDRQKLIHTFGTTAKVNFRIFPNSPYTGVFRSGGPAIARITPGKLDPQNCIPGMALKILVDGKPSVNIVSLFSLEGQGPNMNWFQNPLWTILDEPSALPAKLLMKVFNLALKLIPGGPLDRPESALNVAVYEAAQVDSSGRVVPAMEVVAPYRIAFTPPENSAWPVDTKEDFRAKFAMYPVGHVIYKISAQRTPTSAEEIIGEIVLDSQTVASQYQDSELFFQHMSQRWRPAAVSN